MEKFLTNIFIYAIIYRLLKYGIWRSTQVAIRGSPAKGVDRVTGARVQIPASPPFSIKYEHRAKKMYSTFSAVAYLG